MCFVLEWCVAFLLKLALWLSHWGLYFSCLMHIIHKSSLLAYVVAMYSTYVVDKATTFCSLDCHDTTPPLKVNKYHDLDFLLLMSPDIFESVYPSRIIFAPSKYRQYFEVPLRYLRIHFTSSKCSLPRLARNLLTTPITCAMSSLVHIKRNYTLCSASC